MNRFKDKAAWLHIALRDGKTDDVRTYLEDPDALDVVLRLAHMLAPHDIGGAQVRHTLAEIIDERNGAAMGRAMLDRALGRDVTIGRDVVRIRSLRPNDSKPDKAVMRVHMTHMEALERAGHDASLDVRPGSKSPGDAVSDYVAGMVDDLRARRGEMRRQRDVQDIIERNAPEWQHGPTESEDERARR